MYILKKTTQAELNRVQVNIAKELASEKIIQELYEYIFSTRGKKTRALLCLLASKSAKIKSKDSSGIFFNSFRLSPLISLFFSSKDIYKNKLDSKRIPGST